MKNIVLALALVCGAAHGQEVIDLVKQMKCSNADFVMNEFAVKFQEKPIWVSKTVNGTHIALVMNKEKKTWTLIEYDASVACIIGAGEGGSNAEVF
jgi:hypothetical protein